MVVDLADSRLESAVATLHLEKLWIRDVTVTTGLVDTYTIPGLMRLVASSPRPDDLRHASVRARSLTAEDYGQLVAICADVGSSGSGEASRVRPIRRYRDGTGDDLT